MKCLKGICAVAVMAITAILFSCAGGSLLPVVGSGKIISKSYTNTGFTNISLSDNVQGTISYASTYSVDISIDDNVYPYLFITQQGNTLDIHLQGDTFYQNVTLKVDIKTPDIQTLSLADMSIVNVNGFNLAHDLAVVVKDTSGVKGNISMANLTADIIDKGLVELVGTCGNINLKISDMSKALLRQLTAVNASVAGRDACHVELNCTGAITGTITDNSELYYTGTDNVIVLARDGSKIGKL